jgi:hypothetical protein
MQRFEDLLQETLIISSSFQEVVESRLSKRRRNRQLLLILFYAFYGIPMITSEGLRVFMDVGYFVESLLPDAMSHFGLAGKVLNLSMATFSYFICIEKIMIRGMESSNSLEFLTDLRHLLDAESKYFELNQREVQQLLRNLTDKIIFFRFNLTFTALGSMTLVIIGMTFLVMKTTSLLLIVAALAQMTLYAILMKVAVEHVALIYLSYVIITDCVNARIKSLIHRLESLEVSDGRTKEKDLSVILSDLDSLLHTTLNRYNKILKKLLRNLMNYIKFGLCSIFVVSSIKMEPVMRVISIFPLTSSALMIITAGFYVSTVKTTFMRLCKSLNSVYVKTMIGTRNPKLNIRTRLALKELGSDGHDGHFVVGLADGGGPEISPMEITQTIIETICNSMMFLRIAHHSKY